jgi:hypothetical protein
MMEFYVNRSCKLTKASEEADQRRSRDSWWGWQCNLILIIVDEELKGRNTPRTPPQYDYGWRWRFTGTKGKEIPDR